MCLPERPIEKRPIEIIAKLCANWIIQEVLPRLEKEGKTIAECPVSPKQLGVMTARIADGALSNNTARKVFDALWNGEGQSTDEIIEKQGFRQITDAGAIEALLDGVLAAHPAMVAEFLAGKEKAFNALVGQVMKASRGRTDPQRVNALLADRLNRHRANHA